MKPKDLKPLDIHYAADEKADVLAAIQEMRKYRVSAQATFYRDTPTGAIYETQCPNCGKTLFVHVNGSELCRCDPPRRWFMPLIEAESIEEKGS